jgi:DUF2911 family protein
MKKFLISTALLAAATAILAQQKPAASPPETATGMIGGKTITITYASPRVNGRAGHIFSAGGLISHDPHYPVWRAGANAATTLHTDSNLKFGGLSVPAGTYTLFVDISDPDNWVLIVNKKTGEWGLAYDGSQDLGRVKMKMGKPTAIVENLLWTVDGDGSKGGKITLAWEYHAASVPIAVH